MGFGHLFDLQAAAYAAYRPLYPTVLYQTIFGFANLSTKDVAVDIATGNGQAARVLAQHFTKVIAQDHSEGQLENAEPAPNIRYSRARAEDTGLPTSCADLVTVAQALHWFDLPAFYKECRRILKPTGALAAWGYGLCDFPGNSKANALLHHYYTDVVGPYWDDRRRLIDEQYKGMEPGPEHFAEVEYKVLEGMQSEMSVSGLMGYLRSWSAYVTFREKHPDAPDPLTDFKKEYKAAMGISDDDHCVTVTWPVFVILAKSPQPL